MLLLARESRARIGRALHWLDTLLPEMQVARTTIERLRAHTVLGFVGPPSRGGNRDGKGWAHIQVEDRMSFEPPFGYYDAKR